jgi:hypothetical protein
LPRLRTPAAVLDLRALELVDEDPQSCDVLPDGGGFVFTRRRAANRDTPQIYVVLDWLADLERRFPLAE